MDIGNLVLILIWLVVLGVIFYVAWWGLGKIGLPEPFNKIATVVLVLLTVLVLIWLFVGALPLPARLK